MPNAVFAGSFDPPTSGHLDVIESALSIFDGLYVVLAINPEKDGLFTIDERIEMLNAMNRFGQRMKVCKWDGLVTDFASQHGCTVLVRGLRNAAELPYESTMAYMNQRLDPSIKTVFFLYDAEHVDISSTLVRDLVSHSRLPNDIVPEEVEMVLRQILQRRGQPLS
ncbi:MAG TPA: pantetheine-phosphate adenylyltransferase [Rectinema sp.]|nr:pantetheine-phosphate adenylyltransferase [Rectinema sp.]HQG14331.1 pantetheine-phosphate adenylyltransferase [Rectinema sp.]HQH87203.1 pantetheine-phosphate adenylyltransferase [Rectinema sp.]HQN02283.1 pantetheine-phosphate adenylyltransferase [Rectinema sp.]HRS31367.1 pantetheine-phosphate adenylyltransferase [Rectinema sp.]